MLSPEEKAEFSQAFECDCGEIRDETGGKLAELLHGDILPNLEKSDFSPEMKIKIQALSEKHTIQENIILSENSELYSFFHISKDTAQATQESLAPFNMNIADKLQSYKKYIEEQLGLPDGNSLSKNEHDSIIVNIAKNIGENINTIPEIVSQERSKYNELNNFELVGIINDEIEEGFQNIKNVLLPNAKLFITSTTAGFYENSKDIFYTRGLEGNFRQEELEMHAQMAQAGFRNEITELGNILINGDISDIPDIYNNWGDIGNQFEESIGLQDGLQEISDSSFLSPEDTERYKSAKIRASIFILMQMIPGLDLMGMGVDIFDTFNKTDQSFEILKKLKVIDNDIYVGKAGWERILSGVGAIGGLVSLDVATKGNRVMRVLRSAGITQGDLLREVDSFSIDLGLGEDTSKALKRGISGFGVNRANEGFMSIAQSNGKLSDIPGTDNLEIAGKAISVSSRQKKFLERLIAANKTGEIQIPLDNFTPEQIDNLLSALDEMHEMHGSTKIGKHSFSQIADKLRIAKEHGIPLNISKLMIFEGFAGVSEIKNLNGFNSHGFKIITKNNPALATLLENLSSSSPGDIGDTLGDIDFSSKDTIYAMKSLGGGYIEVEDFDKITRFLKSKGISIPKEILKSIKDNDGIGTHEEEMTQIFGLLEQAQKGNTGDNIHDTTKIVPDILPLVNKVDNLSGIRTTHPEIVELFDSLQDDLRDIGKTLSSIDFSSEGVYDAIDILIENGHGVISQEKFNELSLALGKTPKDIISDLDFIEGEAGITEDFLKGLFRIQEEIATGVPISTDPFEMSLRHLSRLAKKTMGKQGDDIAAYIQESPELQRAVASLEHADYHNPDFLKGDLGEISDFYYTFGKDATQKLITDVFGKGDTDFSKLFANITRYNEALKIAETHKNKRLIQVFEGLGIKNVSTFMTEGLSRVESFISSDWYDRTPESLAYFIGNELSPSRMYVELGKDNFLKLLQELNIDISSVSQDEFFTTIEGLQTYKIAVSLNTAKAAK